MAEWTGLGGPGWLGGVAIGGRGNVFVANPEYAGPNGRIIKLSPNGQKLTDFWDTAQLCCPYAIAIDRIGDMYVANADTDVIVKLSSTGQELAVWDGSGR